MDVRLVQEKAGGVREGEERGSVFVRVFLANRKREQLHPHFLRFVWRLAALSPTQTTVPPHTHTHTHTHTTHTHHPVASLSGDPQSAMGLFSRAAPSSGRLLFESDGGELRVNGRRLFLKGVNMFGFETDSYNFHGLWCASVTRLLDFVQEHKLNALRVPFSAELALGLDTIRPSNIDFAQNPHLQGLTAGQQLDSIVDVCAERGLLIMLDMHHVPKAATGISNLWYDEGAGVEQGEALVIEAWTAMARRFGERWNVFAADLVSLLMCVERRREA